MLVIKSGAEVNFLERELSISVLGSLRIEGTGKHPVRIGTDLSKNKGGFSIKVFDDADITIRNAEIYGGGSMAFQVLRWVNKTMAAEYFGAIQAYGGTVDIKNVTFKKNVVAIVSKIFNIRVNQSRFIDNDFDVYAPNLSKDFRYNWWGSASGPSCEYVEVASGNRCYHPKISEDIDYSEWLTEENDFQDYSSSVLFLPGIMGSRLYWSDTSCSFVNCENKLWVANRSADGEKLYMDEGVSKTADIYAKENDIVSTAGPLNARFYKSFVEDMNALVGPTRSVAAWKPIAYDWRYDYRALLKNGRVDNGKIYYGDTAVSPYIVSEFLKLAKESNTGKVTIVAHSNGGLLAKALTKRLEDMGDGDLVDKIVFVASPQIGTPQAVGALLHGYNPSSEINFLVKPKVQRKLSHDMPMSYNLLPSKEYFDTVRKPVVEFAESLEKQRDAFDETINSYEEEHDFLLGKDDRQEPDFDDLNDPAIANKTLLGNAEDWHDDFDHWKAPMGAEVYQIAGWGVDTVRGIGYDKAPWYSSASMSYQPIMTEDGDGTVVTPSALYDDAGERYYVDLNKYKSITGNKNNHADILEIPELRTFVEDIIDDDGSVTLPEYISQSRPSIIDVKKRLRYYLHSPLTLEMYDAEGHHVGYSSETGNIDMDIPGAIYNEFGEVKYISVPEDIATKLVMHGQDAGRFVLNVEETEGDTIINQTTFANIEVSPQTVVTMDIPANTEPIKLAGLSIDQDGDGTTESVISPGTIINDQDSDAPITSISFSGTEGQNGWYMSDIVVTLSADDGENGSGVGKIEYSINDDTVWHEYFDPITFSQEGKNVIRYRSIDKARNQEEQKSANVNIDKTAPEARISFDKDAQKLEITGSDALSSTAVVFAEKSELNVKNKKWKSCKEWFSHWYDRHKKRFPDMLATITDQAGHTASISFEKTIDRKGFIFVHPLTIEYDGKEAIILKDASVQYKWKTDRKGAYQFFVSSLRSGDNAIESHYIPWKDETWIMKRLFDLKDDNQDNVYDRGLALQKLSGMEIPYLESNQGNVTIKY